MKDFTSIVEQIEDLTAEVQDTAKALTTGTKQLTKKMQTQVDAIEKVEDLDKVFPALSTINTEMVQTPKKKKKYYPRKPKTQI